MSQGTLHLHNQIDFQPKLDAGRLLPWLDQRSRDRTGRGRPSKLVVMEPVKSNPPHAASRESTALLLDRLRSGDDSARERLMARFLPLLQRWARGRLPAYARGSSDTDDLVQITLLRALKHVEHFEDRGEGAFLAYLRRILLNAVRDEIRRASRRSLHDALDNEVPDPSPSAVERAIGREAIERYEQALSLLEPRQREAVLLRVEFGYSYAQIAEAVSCPTANGARMVVSRALVKMAKEMQ